LGDRSFHTTHESAGKTEIKDDVAASNPPVYRALNVSRSVSSMSGRTGYITANCDNWERQAFFWLHGWWWL
jgi:hypothetical protein